MNLLFAVLFIRNLHQKFIFMFGIWKNLKITLHFSIICVYLLFYFSTFEQQERAYRDPDYIFTYSINTNIWKQEFATLHITRKEKKGQDRRGEEVSAVVWGCRF